MVQSFILSAGVFEREAKRLRRNSERGCWSCSESVGEVGVGTNSSA